MKSAQIKIWPEIKGYLPVIIPWQNVKTQQNDIFIDFSNCKSVYSSGLTLLLLRTIGVIIQEKNNRKWETHSEIISDTFQKIVSLNFFNILQYFESNTSMFWRQEFANLSTHKLVHQNDYYCEVHSLPIYHIKINDFLNRRDILKEFRKSLNELLLPYYRDYDFNLTQLTLILNEILKNSADHTKTNAFLGLDIIFINNQEIEINFTIGDLGEGINLNVKKHLPTEKFKKRYEFWDLTQTYRFALSKGGTTKNDSIDNKGMGMSIILDGARKIGLELSVFDAESRGLLTSITSLTHSEIRRNFFNIGRHIGFCYHGTLRSKKL
jgi:hypothetical protein